MDVAKQERLTLSIVSGGIFLILLVYFSQIIPPFQSNDEYDHIERGYLLSKGVFQMSLGQASESKIPRVIAFQEEGRSRGLTGGVINAGLFDYMEAFKELTLFDSSHLSVDKLKHAKKIQWSSKNVYRTAPGTAIYFPAVYAPHAMGLFIGEYLGLSLHHSYMLTKYILITCIIFVLMLAFSFFPPTPLLLFLLLLPRSLYQFSSATIDGFSTALAILAISLFLHLLRFRKTQDIHTCMFAILVLLVGVITTSRLHFMPFELCVFYLAWRERSFAKLMMAFFGMLLSIVWYVMILSQHAIPSYTGTSTFSTIIFYCQHPMMLWDMYQSTFLSEYLRGYFTHGLIAEIGWYQGVNYFSSEFYEVTFFFGYSIALMSFSLKHFKENYPQYLCLLMACFFSVILVTLSMLFTHTPISSEYILGIQGRYFLLPLILFSYAIGGNISCGEGWRRKVGMVILILYGVISIFSLNSELFNRYYFQSLEVYKYKGR